MLVPVDDHLVHRGDGVFDSAKCIGGKVFNFDAHIARLLRCAEAIGISSPWAAEDIKSIAYETITAGGHPDCSVRIIIARGPGGMGVAPSDSPRPSLYVATYRTGPVFMDSHPNGASLVRSELVAKLPRFATVKSCNYLQNVLMKAELAMRGADFICSFDNAGYLAEGPTENDGIVTANGILAFPKPDNILAGTTMMRCIAYGEKLAKEGLVAGVEHRDISEADMFAAREIIACGTTIHVVSVTSYEGKPVADGKPGPVAAALQRMLEDEMGLSN
jgi:branched-chain amino acid aminotransferase